MEGAWPALTNHIVCLLMFKLPPSFSGDQLHEEDIVFGCVVDGREHGVFFALQTQSKSDANNRMEF